MRPQDKWDSLLQYHIDRVFLESKRKLRFDLVKAQMLKESSGYSLARSPVGACGLFQLMPATAVWWRVKNIFDPDENTRGALDYMNYLLGLVENFQPQQDWLTQYAFALESYNGGWGYVRQAIKNVVAAGGSPDRQTVAEALKTVSFKGKKPDWRQMVGYANDILSVTEEKGG